MRRVLLLFPILAANWLLIGFGMFMYGLFVDLYIARLGTTQLWLSDNLTHACVGFAASWCDETWNRSDPSPVIDQWGILWLDCHIPPANGASCVGLG
jgi:hypothetical protein